LLKEAIRKKSLVIVAGSGISKDIPSNLPSWWEYNKIIIDEIRVKPWSWYLMQHYY
jgi:hypothetical protein